ncbi:hypothetical protein GCM10022393_09590 [Aquimarina addita]|uniref:Fibronectin type-III domain-containing protein n=1 Tax=Aquimarina addita TaxID=870485 RepID=A0ABP7XCL5_9FLAO
MFFGGVQFSIAQDATVITNEIKVITRVQEDAILLRWAATTPVSWLKGNNFGYQIERFTISRDGMMLQTPEKKVLTQTPLKPASLENWENMVNDNDYAAILAQALYGETFAVEQTQGGLAQIINTAKEIDQRFAFALFAADMNFEAAKKAAMAYTDSNIVANEEYLYTITSQIPEEILSVKPGLVTVKVTKPEPLPVPLDLFAVPKDKNILLTWEYHLFKGVFTSYYIERSENEIDFKRLGDTPLVNMNDKPNAPARRMFYIDTIAQNDTTYSYRVQGISPFGELSPYSEVVSAAGIKKLEAVAHISGHSFDDIGGVDITWEFPKEAEQEITEFQLLRAPQDQGPYSIVAKEIAPDVRTINCQELYPSNYFKITAIGKGKEKTTSFSSFVQAIDSIPPIAPVGMTGTVDTLGIVRVTWQHNPEKDLLGYRVFRGNLAKEEFIQLTVAPIEKASFIDTVQVKSLNAQVYYKIVAVDKRYNMSPYSEVLTLKKPDVIPPSSPIFRTYNVSTEGILLQWINSSSEDVSTHQLYRQQTKDVSRGWLPIFTTDTVSSYIDKAIIPETSYRYAIFAEDQSGLQSSPSTPITVTSQQTKEEGVKRLNTIVDRVQGSITLSWKLPADDIVEISIYKSKKEEPPVLFKQLPGTIKEVIDTAVSPNNTYIYQIKTVTKGGGHSSIQTKEVIF